MTSCGAAVEPDAEDWLGEDRLTDAQGPTAEECARLAGELALEKKAADVVLLDVRGFPIGCDYFLIASGSTDVQVRAIADWIQQQLRERLDVRPWHVEGAGHGRWILLDYVDLVVHLFHAETREYYLLERLWGDAPREDLTDGTDLPATGAAEPD
jgi:ribosome-associated protein